MQAITVVLACHQQLVGFRHALMFAGALVLFIFREARVASGLDEARRNLAMGAGGDLTLTLEVLTLEFIFWLVAVVTVRLQFAGLENGTLTA